MASVYKKFTAQDKAIIPFNAHKQYVYTSASSATNQVKHFNTQYTSESISLYSSASAAYGGDTKNIVKYNQIDNLFYRNYKRSIDTKLGPHFYDKQLRDLYEKTNILSIPVGLSGREIKPTSFYLSSSIFEVVDDKYGNLIISGTNTNNYPNDIHENVFRLDPIKGFKKYDLGVFDGYASVQVNTRVTGDIPALPILNGDNGTIYPDPSFPQKLFWKQGSENPRAPLTYTSRTDNHRYGKFYLKDEDDSCFFNELHYSNVTFKTSSLGSTNHKFPTINFNSATGSYIKTNHNERFNFGKTQDFSISFYMKPSATGSDGGMSNSEKRYIISKNGSKTATPASASATTQVDAPSEDQFPFEIYMQSQSLYFARSDGNRTFTINGEVTSSGTAKRTSHILCQNTGSTMQIYFDGNLIASTTTSFLRETKNTADLYIGSKGNVETKSDTDNIPIKYFNGEIGNINIWARAYNSTIISNISESINARPFIGNIFYPSGLATITHPKYYDILSGSKELSGGINSLQFQGTHLIYEHEYQCTVGEHEYNSTYNLSARKENNIKSKELANFTTSSYFKPYVTTIGLYNEKNELLLVGKLGQPVKMSNETDTTFIVRWDT
tara:strand:+ start:82 stop:1914 length:1833 start_codon:yes stop_codon:yes gene_type:complete